MTEPDSGAEYRLTGQLRVDLPPQDAFRLFTPRGEQDWDEWRPLTRWVGRQVAQQR